MKRLIYILVLNLIEISFGFPDGSKYLPEIPQKREIRGFGPDAVVTKANCDLKESSGGRNVYECYEGMPPIQPDQLQQTQYSANIAPPPRPNRLYNTPHKKLHSLPPKYLYSEPSPPQSSRQYYPPPPTPKKIIFPPPPTPRKIQLYSTASQPSQLYSQPSAPNQLYGQPSNQVQQMIDSDFERALQSREIIPANCEMTENDVTEENGVPVYKTVYQCAEGSSRNPVYDQGHRQAYFSRRSK